jgi:hypothetical protein
MGAAGYPHRSVGARLSPAAQAAFDRSALTSSRATAIALGINKSQVDSLIHGGRGRPDVVARIEEQIASGALGR